MTRLEVRKWNGQYGHRGVIQRIRRKIQGRLQQGCVLVDFEGVTGISPDHLLLLLDGWPEEQVKICGCVESLCCPLPPGVRPHWATGPKK
jgi:hypothetical protein